jgi:hypothetical protein
VATRRPKIRSHADVAFAGDGEGGEKIGEDEEVADLLAEVVELEGGSTVFSGDIDAYERAEAHRVHVGEVGEVKDDALVGAEELGDGKVKEIGVAGEEFAVTADEGGGAAILDLEGEGFGGNGFGHA